jgi:type IV pilus assembly protein PilB
MPRLLDIGVIPDIIAGNLIGVVSQRLIRRLCPHCKTDAPPTELEQRLLALPAETRHKPIFKAVGCPACENQGYKGRVSIIEILKISADMDDLIARRASAREMKNLALSEGFRPLVVDACRRVLDGTTSVDEISRVVDLTDRLRD